MSGLLTVMEQLPLLFEFQPVKSKLL